MMPVRHGRWVPAMALAVACGGPDPKPAATPESSARVASKAAVAPSPADARAPLLTGADALGDFTTDAPGVRRKITLNDLPPPYATPSVDTGSKTIRRPPGALPRVPEGFVVGVLLEGLDHPRMVRVAPNGDVFIVESWADRARVLRDGQVAKNTVFAQGLKGPFGLAFYPPNNPQYVYIANTDSVVRYPYGGGAPETVVDNLSGGGHLRGGGHWTRDIVFSRDGSKMYVSVGSKSNVSDDPAEHRRARIFEYSPDGKNERVFATGIRNPVGLAVHPITGDVWTSVNERDELGDQLVPDYITRVKDGGFYGWPWFYIGGHQDPRHEGKHPELRDEVLTPDVLLQSHSASLGMTFTSGSAFPEPYRDGAFAAEHGSWNRSHRTGYKVIFVPAPGGKPTGEYVDFMTGFVTPQAEVWGRPASVAVHRDGSLLVADDEAGCIWRVTAPSRK